MTRSEIQTLIDGIQTGTKNTALEFRTVLGLIADGTGQTGDIKEIDVTNAYLTANFDASGLGTNERLGWAICNGNNGTRDRSGKSGMQYNSTYPVLGATGGSETVTLVKNNIPTMDITLPVSDADSGGGSKVYVMATDVEASGTKTYANTVNASSPSTPVNIRSPYIVSLFIMKL
jgi:hypothetical protein